MSSEEGSKPSGCPLRAGMERHVWPSGDGKGTVTKSSSDAIFGPDGLGFGNTFWTTIVSWLARNGIQEQTGSKPNTTDIEACVKGWGQGAYSSRVFDAEKGVNEEQLERLVTHLDGIAKEVGAAEGRYTNKVMAKFVATQSSKPFSTFDGERVSKSFKARTGSRFRGHIQWQALVILCGLVDQSGVKHVTPELLRTFFNSEEPFFERIKDRRKGLKDGSIAIGDPSGILADVPDNIDRKATDKAFRKNKSGMAMVIRIAWYMLFGGKSKLGPLPGT